MAALVHKPGDKIKLKRQATKAPGSRGVVLTVAGQSLVVRLEPAGNLLTVAPTEVTNFSLAARKAWRNMPDRDVGRPKGSRVCDRVSVTIRVDRDLWQHFRDAESAGIIVDRTATVNTWIREQLHKIAPAVKTP